MSRLLSKPGSRFKYVHGDAGNQSPLPPDISWRYVRFRGPARPMGYPYRPDREMAYIHKQHWVESQRKMLGLFWREFRVRVDFLLLTIHRDELKVAEDYTADAEGRFVIPRTFADAMVLVFKSLRDQRQKFIAAYLPDSDVMKEIAGVPMDKRSSTLAIDDVTIRANIREFMKMRPSLKKPHDAADHEFWRILFRPKRYVWLSWTMPPLIPEHIKSSENVIKDLFFRLVEVEMISLFKLVSPELKPKWRIPYLYDRATGVEIIMENSPEPDTSFSFCGPSELINAVVSPLRLLHRLENHEWSKKGIRIGPRKSAFQELPFAPVPGKDIVPRSVRKKKEIRKVADSFGRYTSAPINGTKQIKQTAPPNEKKTPVNVNPRPLSRASAVRPKFSIYRLPRPYPAKLKSIHERSRENTPTPPQAVPSPVPAGLKSVEENKASKEIISPKKSSIPKPIRSQGKETSMKQEIKNGNKEKKYNKVNDMKIKKSLIPKPKILQKSNQVHPTMKQEIKNENREKKCNKENDMKIKKSLIPKPKILQKSNQVHPTMKQEIKNENKEKKCNKENDMKIKKSLIPKPKILQKSNQEHVNQKKDDKKEPEEKKVKISQEKIEPKKQTTESREIKNLQKRSLIPMAEHPLLQKTKQEQANKEKVSKTYETVEEYVESQQAEVKRTIRKSRLPKAVHTKLQKGKEEEVNKEKEMSLMGRPRENMILETKEQSPRAPEVYAQGTRSKEESKKSHLPTLVNRSDIIKIQKQYTTTERCMSRLEDIKLKRTETDVLNKNVKLPEICKNVTQNVEESEGRKSQIPMRYCPRIPEVSKNIAENSLNKNVKLPDISKNVKQSTEESRRKTSQVPRINFNRKYKPTTPEAPHKARQPAPPLPEVRPPLTRKPVAVYNKKKMTMAEKEAQRLEDALKRRREMKKLERGQSPEAQCRGLRYKRS